MPRRPPSLLMLLLAVGLALPWGAAGHATAVEPDPPALREAYRRLFSSEPLGSPVRTSLVLGWTLHYRGTVGHSAFAFARLPDGRSTWRFLSGRPSPEDARGLALAGCRRDIAALPEAECQVLAVDAVPEDGSGAVALPFRGSFGPFRWSPLHWRHGPDAARGVIVWGHGYGGPERDFRAVPLPGFVSALNDAGWDVLRFDRAAGEDNLFTALPRLVEALPALRDAGYRRIVLGGQSRGGWQALLAAAERPDLVDSVIATSPAAHGETSRPNNHATAIEDFSRAIGALPADRVRLAVALFDGDGFDPSPAERAALVQAAAAARQAPTLALWPENGARGHGGAQDWRFTRDHTGCVMTLLNAPEAGAPRGLRRAPCGGG